MLLSFSLRETRVEFCQFEELELPNLEATDSQILNCDFYNTNLEGANFGKSDFKQSMFENCNLQKVAFDGAVNYEIDPDKNRIKGASFSYPEVLSLLQKYKINVTS